MGGRRQKSAVDAVMALIHDIEAAKREKKITSELFIDIKGAFVSKACLLETMGKFGLPNEITTWTNPFMTDRYTKLVDGQSDSLKAINTGIPQGSPVSPILFLIYFTRLFDVINKCHPNTICPSYIDDIGLIVSGYVYPYTDCSKLDNGQTGAGAIIYQYNKSDIQISHSMGDECEVYDAEFVVI
jgi:hypothetical protein